MTALRNGTWLSFCLCLALALGVTGVLGIAVLSGKGKLMIVAGGALGGLAIAYLSGNPRLLCVWGLMMALPLHLSKLFTEFSDRGGGESAIRIEIADVFMAPLFVALLADVWSGRTRRGMRIPKALVPWLLVMLMGAATVLFGSWRRVAAYEVIRMAKAVVLLLVIANELNRPQRLVQGAIALVTSMLAESVIGVLQYARGSSLGLEKLGETATKTIEVLAVKSIVGMEVWRVSALLLHPNVFGIFLAAVLPLAIGFFVLKNGWIYKSISLLACGLGTFALLVTYSRSSWASYAAAFALMMLLLVLHRPLRSRALVLAGVAGLVLLIMLGAFSDKIMTRLLHSQESATSARAQWRWEARLLIKERPVAGWGLNSYVDVVLPFSKLSRRAYSGWVPPVHNIYLLWWAETGIVGLGLYLLVWAAFVWTGVKNLRAGDTVLYVINAACLCGMIAFAVDGFFSLSLRINAIMRLFFVLGGMMMAVRYMLLEARCAAAVEGSTAGRSTVR